MAITTTEPRNWNYIAVRTIIWFLMLTAIGASYTHIVHLFNIWGLFGWQAWIAPAFIDGFALLGLIGRGRSFAPETQRVGLKIQISATGVSVIANVWAGETTGARVFGVLVVAGYVLAEIYGGHMRPAATKAELAKAAKSESAKQAAITRAANKAEADRKAAERKERTKLARLAKQAEMASTEMASIERTFASTVAPISPAPFDYDQAAYL